MVSFREGYHAIPLHNPRHTTKLRDGAFQEGEERGLQLSSRKEALDGSGDRFAKCFHVM